MEYLVAAQTAARLTATTDGEATDTADASLLVRREMSPLMADFLCGVAGHEAALGWAQSTLRNRSATTAGKANALAVGTRLGVRVADVDLVGQDLREQDLTGRDLSFADLTGATLAGTRLRGTNLAGATLAGADLSYSTLNGVTLAGADLTDADLTGVTFLRCDLRGAQVEGSRWVRAALLGTEIDGDAAHTSPWMGGRGGG